MNKAPIKNKDGKTEMAEYAAAAGDKLPNSALLLSEFLVASADHPAAQGIRRTVVLCLIPESQDPFATWYRMVGPAPLATGGEYLLDQCSDGHYYRDVKDALADFIRRSCLEHARINAG